MSIPERAEEVFNRQNSYNCYFEYGKFGKSHESTFYSQNGLTKDQNRDTIKMRNVGCYTFYERCRLYLRGSFTRERADGSKNAGLDPAAREFIN